MLVKEDVLQIILGKYEGISELLRNHTYEEIADVTSSIIQIDRIKMEQSVVKGFTPKKERAQFKYVVTELMKNIEKYDWTYEHLEDEVSKEVFTNLIRFRLIPDMQFRENASQLSNEALEKEVMLAIEHQEGESAVSGVIKANQEIKNRFVISSVCVDDVISDLWVIPMLIYSIREDYCFHLKHQIKKDKEKTIFYLVPKVVPQKTYKEIKRVVAMSPYERPWSNVELVKDCGLIPYLLYKNHGCDASMVGAKGGEYPYASLVEGMKLEYLEDGSTETKIKYILEKAKEIDCLILRGCYSSNIPVAYVYKMYNPEGVIYVGLDANSYWTDHILWDREDFVKFMNCCDYIATSCTAMQKHLTEKWPWDIHCIPNGYYSFSSNENQAIDWDKKEKIILTVGRLGTWQKATEVLLEAYALIAAQIPQWKLRLVGNIEEKFQDYLKDYNEKYPELINNITFTGSIENRDELHEEYKKAQIFAMTSRREGGAPNVIAEALHAGCVMALTEFDAYEDAVRGGECGLSSPIDDVEKYAEILLELCTKADLKKLSQNAIKAAEEFFDMEKIVGGLYDQLCNKK